MRVGDADYGLGPRIIEMEQGHYAVHHRRAQMSLTAPR